jgi:hypothetical protein
MNNLLTVFFTVLVSLAFQTAFSKPVSKTSATAVARNFMARWGNSGDLKSGVNPNFVCEEYGKLLNSAGTPSESPAFYIFNAEGGGFIIVSGDDGVTPVLAFSRESNIDPGNIPDNVRSFFRGYEKEIIYISKSSSPPSADIEGEWKKYINDAGELKSSAVIDSVKPLTTTRWGYGKPYNQFCPKDSTIPGPGTSVRLNKHCPAGCAAIAMAQILKYWNFPKKGWGCNAHLNDKYGYIWADFGRTEYTWNDMPDDLDDNSPDYQKNSVATLIYHCGVSLNMDYGFDKSGIFREDPHTGRNTFETAFETYFGYKNSLKAVVKSSYTDLAWKEMMKNEIVSGRPIIYDGKDEVKDSGHAFIIDGYKTINNTTYFHINWGLYHDWDNSVYCLINSLGFPGYDFTDSASVLIGIEPDTMRIQPEVCKSEDLDLGEKIKIWPNPVSDRLNIDLSNYRESLTDIDILNGLGMKILSVSCTGTQKQITLDKLTDGIYFIRFENRGKIITKKFIVRK